MPQLSEEPCCELFILCVHLFVDTWLQEKNIAVRDKILKKHRNQAATYFPYKLPNSLGCHCLAFMRNYPGNNYSVLFRQSVHMGDFQSQGKSYKKCILNTLKECHCNLSKRIHEKLASLLASREGNQRPAGQEWEGDVFLLYTLLYNLNFVSHLCSTYSYRTNFYKMTAWKG